MKEEHGRVLVLVLFDIGHLVAVVDVAKLFRRRERHDDDDIDLICAWRASAYSTFACGRVSV